MDKYNKNDNIDIFYILLPDDNTTKKNNKWYNIDYIVI